METRYRRLSLGDIVRYEGLQYRVEAMQGAVLTLIGHGHPARLGVLAGSIVADELEIVGRVPYTVAPERELTELGLVGTKQEWFARCWLDAVVLVTTGRMADMDWSEPVLDGFDQSLELKVRVANALVFLSGRGISTTAKTVYRKIHDYELNPTILSLVDGRAARKSAVYGRANDFLIEKMREVVELRRDKSDVTERMMMGEVRALVKAENPEFEFPHRATQYKYLRRVLDEISAPSTKQRQSASKNPATTYGKISASRPGEFVHIDSTPFSCMLLNERGEAQRYEFTMMIDVFSLHILGFILAPTTRAQDVLRLVARASFPPSLRPHGEVAASIADAELEPRQLVRWYERGEPAPFVAIDTLVIDNGTPYVAEDTKRGLETLGISIRYSRTYTPEDKGKIERALKSVETGLVQYIPGFVGRSPDHRGARVDAEGLLHRTAAVELITEWIEAVWANDSSQGLRDPFNRKVFLTPKQVLETAVAVAPSLPVPVLADAYLRFLPSFYRRVQHYGIDHENMVFDSEQLNPLRRIASPDKAHKGRYMVKWDPDYPVVLWVRDYKNHDWIMTTWVQAGDFLRPFRRDILRGVGAVHIPPDFDSDQATRELVDSYRPRLTKPAKPTSIRKKRASTPYPRTSAKRRTLSTSRTDPDDVRPMTRDDEMDI